MGPRIILHPSTSPIRQRLPTSVIASKSRHPMIDPSSSNHVNDHSPFSKAQIPSDQDTNAILTELRALTTSSARRYSNSNPNGLTAKQRERAKPPPWELVDDGKGIRRTFRFKNFQKTWVSVDFLS